MGSKGFGNVSLHDLYTLNTKPIYFIRNVECLHATDVPDGVLRRLSLPGLISFESLDICSDTIRWQIDYHNTLMLLLG
jgi:hypothetical protein